jgi:hypothetical protein
VNKTAPSGFDHTRFEVPIEVSRRRAFRGNLAYVLPQDGVANGNRVKSSNGSRCSGCSASNSSSSTIDQCQPTSVECSFITHGDNGDGNRFVEVRQQGYI